MREKKPGCSAHLSHFKLFKKCKKINKITEYIVSFDQLDAFCFEENTTLDLSDMLTLSSFINSSTLRPAVRDC